MKSKLLVVAALGSTFLGLISTPLYAANDGPGGNLTLIGIGPNQWSAASNAYVQKIASKNPPADNWTVPIPVGGGTLPKKIVLNIPAADWANVVDPVLAGNEGVVIEIENSVRNALNHTITVDVWAMAASSGGNSPGGPFGGDGNYQRNLTEIRVQANNGSLIATRYVAVERPWRLDLSTTIDYDHPNPEWKRILVGPPGETCPFLNGIAAGQRVPAWIYGKTHPMAFLNQWDHRSTAFEDCEAYEDLNDGTTGQLLKVANGEFGDKLGVLNFPPVVGGDQNPQWNVNDARCQNWENGRTFAVVPDVPPVGLMRNDLGTIKVAGWMVGGRGRAISIALDQNQQRVLRVRYNFFGRTVSTAKPQMTNPPGT